MPGAEHACAPPAPHRRPTNRPGRRRRRPRQRGRQHDARPSARPHESPAPHRATSCRSTAVAARSRDRRPTHASAARIGFRGTAREIRKGFPVAAPEEALTRRQRHPHRQRRRADQRVPGPPRRRRPVRRRPRDPPPPRLGLGNEGDHPALRGGRATTPSAPTSTPARASMSIPTTPRPPPARPAAFPTSKFVERRQGRGRGAPRRSRRRTARSASSATARAGATPSSPP